MWVRIALDASEMVATRFLTNLENRFMQAQTFPFAGSPREQLAPGLRTIFHQNYGVYYTATATEVVIVRVIHGARDVAALAAQGGFAVEMQ